MKHLYLLLALLGAALATRAQNSYVPLFRSGHVYQYTEAGTPGDTTHSMRMAFPRMTGADSVAALSGRVVPVLRNTPACYVTQAQRPDGLFGATVSIKTLSTGKEYTVRAANGRTFLLKPQAAPNQPWTATTAGLTAQVTARAAATTFGQPDQVTTISLSDGQTIRYSAQWGYLEGPNLGSYLNGQRRRQLTLTAINGPGFTLGQPAVGARAIFDYQPGDVYLYYNKQEANTGGMICSEIWTRDSITARTTSGSGDITYGIWRRTLTRLYGSPSAPTSFCRNTPGTTLSPGFSTTFTVAATDEALLGPLTHNLAGVASYQWRPLTFAGVRTSNYNGRKTQRTLLRQVCQPVPAADSVLLTNILDNGRENVYAVGLGEVSSTLFEIYFTRTNTLLGYRKVNLPTSTGVETWGSLRTFAAILQTAKYRPAASTVAFPNPFAGELTVRFATQSPQLATIDLYNALGQRVHTAQQRISGGTVEWALRVPSLPTGVYALHLTHDNRTEVLRVVAGR